MLVSLAQNKDGNKGKQLACFCQKAEKKQPWRSIIYRLYLPYVVEKALFNSCFHISPVHEKLKFTKCFNVHIKLFSLYSGMKGPGGMLKII